MLRRALVVLVDRGHGESQIIDGDIHNLESDLIDENLRGINEWFERQNQYSHKDADFELAQESQSDLSVNLLAVDPLKRRAALKRIARRMPMRGLMYFLYSYVWRRGFLEGRDGFVFCSMRAIYQSMIAIKKYDTRRIGRARPPR